MTNVEKYQERLCGIDRRMRTWILADRKRLRHASCRCWLDPTYQAIELFQDAGMWRIWTGYQIGDELDQWNKAVRS